MDAQNTIYGLVDPRTNEVRYIGLSSKGFYRPNQHRYFLDREKTYKANWLRGLRDVGLAPVIHVLETVEKRGDLPDVECFWIAQGYSLGWPLTNLTKGGDGTFGRKDGPETLARKSAWVRTAETKAKLSASSLGKKMSAEARDKMRLAKLGKKQTSEQIENRIAPLRGAKRDPEVLRKAWATRKARGG